jgi:energy-converting hydrogenase Eha subunit A
MCSLPLLYCSLFFALVLFDLNISTVVAENLRLDGGNDGWDVSAWRVVVDGVMGGKSSGYLNFEDSQRTMSFDGNIDLDGGGFSSVRKPFSLTNLSTYSGIILELEANTFLEEELAPLGLHLRLEDADSQCRFSAAFAIPLAAESNIETKVFIPMESFDKASRFGWSCSNAVLNPTKVNGMGIHVLFQEGSFGMKIKSITAVEGYYSFPSPLFPFQSVDEVTTLIENTIKSGSYLYNNDYRELCVAIYWSTLNTLLNAPTGVPEEVKGVICAGLLHSSTQDNKADIAWTLRYTMDAVVADMEGNVRTTQQSWLPEAASASTYARKCSGVTSVLSDPSLFTTRDSYHI